MKFTMTKIAAGLVLAAAVTGAQAAPGDVISLTIEEIGASGVGTSAAGAGAGLFYFSTTGAVPDGSSGISFTSGTDGGIIPGKVQANSEMATGFAYGGSTPNFFANSCGANQTGCTGAIGATYSAGTLSLNLADFGGYYTSFSTQFTLFPDGASQPLIVSASALGAGGLAANEFYYTADWTHTITASEPGGLFFGNQIADWHFEGVGTIAPIPEASTYGMMLAGLGLVGFAVRRRKLMA